jgi:hypothetical protein
MKDTSRRIAEALLDRFQIGNTVRSCDGPLEWDEATVKEVAAVVEGAMGCPWIPVSERPPDRNVNVLVCIPAADEKIYIASLDEGGMWFSSDPAADAYSLGEHGAPSHWMPLPAPPPG